jgi:hypothetical protein
MAAPGDKKLVSNLQQKKNYVSHYKYFKLCVKNGLRITKIHDILQIKQSKWLLPYVQFNTDKEAIHLVRKILKPDHYKSIGHPKKRY